MPVRLTLTFSIFGLLNAKAISPETASVQISADAKIVRREREPLEPGAFVEEDSVTAKRHVPSTPNVKNGNFEKITLERDHLGIEHYTSVLEHPLNEVPQDWDSATPTQVTMVESGDQNWGGLTTDHGDVYCALRNDGAEIHQTVTSHEHGPGVKYHLTFRISSEPDKLPAEIEVELHGATSTDALACQGHGTAAVCPTPDWDEEALSHWVDMTFEYEPTQSDVSFTIRNRSPAGGDRTILVDEFDIEEAPAETASSTA